jgi:hypothetical protein
VNYRENAVAYAERERARKAARLEREKSGGYSRGFILLAAVSLFLVIIWLAIK